jgi:hypothetical protein
VKQSTQAIMAANNITFDPKRVSPELSIVHERQTPSRNAPGIQSKLHLTLKQPVLRSNEIESNSLPRPDRQSVMQMQNARE